MRLRRMTPAEEDAAGLSLPEECSICPADHICGGCGTLIHHHEGTTCSHCCQTIHAALTNGEE